MNVGQRVRLTDETLVKTGFPEELREGVVTEVKLENGGVFVQHPDGSVYGWGFSEIEEVE